MSPLPQEASNNNNAALLGEESDATQQPAAADAASSNAAATVSATTSTAPYSTATTTTPTTTTTTTAQPSPPLFVFSANGSSETWRRRGRDDLSDDDSPATTATVVAAAANPFVFASTWRNNSLDSAQRRQQQSSSQQPHPIINPPPNNNDSNNVRTEQHQPSQQQQPPLFPTTTTSTTTTLTASLSGAVAAVAAWAAAPAAAAAAPSSSSTTTRTLTTPLFVPSTTTTTSAVTSSSSSGVTPTTSTGIPIPTFAPFDNNTFSSSNNEPMRRTLLVRRARPSSQRRSNHHHHPNNTNGNGNSGSRPRSTSGDSTAATARRSRMPNDFGGGTGRAGQQQQQQQQSRVVHFGLSPEGAAHIHNNRNTDNGGNGAGAAPRRLVTLNAAAAPGGVEGGGGGTSAQPMSMQFRIPPGARVRVHRSTIGGGAMPPLNNTIHHVSMSGMGNGTRSIGVSSMGGGGAGGGEVRVPPLQPLVMMDSLQDIRSSTDDTNHHENGSSPSTTTSNNNNNNIRSVSPRPDFERFKCSLCYEFMRVAYACGASQCGSRFCPDCVNKLEVTAANNGNSHDTNNNKLCPTCRTVVQGDNFVRDESICVDDMPPIPCRFRGCQERLKLEYVAAHEVICPMVRMTCKYKSFGCSWTGPRGELSRHEDDDCPLGKIPVVVEQLRVVQATQQQQFGHLNIRTQMAVQLVESHNQRLVQLERPSQAAAAAAATTTAVDSNKVSTSNPMDVLSFVSAILVCQPTFHKLAEGKWRPFLTAEGRATVFNMTMMLSPTLVFGKLWYEFYARFLQILGGGATGQDQTCPQTDDCGLFSGIMSLVSCIMIGSVFLVDNTSSRTWEFGHLSAFTQLALRGVFFAAIGFGLQFFGLFRGLILLWWTLVSAVVFPTLLAGVSIKHARLRLTFHEATALFISNLSNTGRAFDPLVFGIRTALPCVIFGPAATVTSVLLVEVIQPLFSHVPIAFAMKPIFPGSTVSRIVEYIVLFLVACALVDLPVEILQAADDEAVRLGRQGFVENILSEAGRSLFAFLTVIATNLFIWSLSRFGVRLANKLVELEPVPPAGSNLPASVKDSSVGGSIVVAAWVAVLVFIAAT